MRPSSESSAMLSIDLPFRYATHSSLRCWSLRSLILLILVSLLTTSTSSSDAADTTSSVQIPRACVAPHDHYPFCNASLPLDHRLDDLISRLTLEEKPYLLTASESPKGNISRLGIPECKYKNKQINLTWKSKPWLTWYIALYLCFVFLDDWGGNCIHGVQSRCAPLNDDGTNGKCPTSFPNPNMLGATFNQTLWKAMGSVIGVELRSLWLQNVGENHDKNFPHIGLDCWSPNVNIVRDPRWVIHLVPSNFKNSWKNLF